MKKIQTIAPAKINLCLEVVKKFPDGFHEIRSIMMKSKYLYDTLVIEFDENNEGIVIECDNEDVPIDEKNICWKIAENYFSEIGKRIGIKIVITKRIPILAGLGGGSSDGASVLLALNKYFQDELSINTLVNIAAEVGKDIPFFLQEASVASVGGTGNLIESIFDFPQLQILVINPKKEIETPWAYGQLDQRQWFMNSDDRNNLTLLMKENHDTVNDIVQYIYNDFSFIAQEQCHQVGEIKNAMKSFGAKATSISGKGPTVFGIFDSIKDLKKVQNILQKQYPKFFISAF